jgi:hypothetical protein
MLEKARKMSVPSLPDLNVEPISRVEFARAAGIEPDEWQAMVLESEERKLLMLCSRQSGKSTTAAMLAVHEAIYQPGSLALCLAPSLRQSGELFRTCRQIVGRVEVEVPEIIAESALRLELGNGSRIIALPGSESTTRGYSAATLVVIDEAARVSDELIAAVRPTLATTNGRIIALSTPAGKRGWFYLEWASGQGWFRTKVVADDCPRISSEFLEDERRILGEHQFMQEYMCEFYDADSAVFSSEMIEAAMSDHVEPLWEAA